MDGMQDADIYVCVGYELCRLSLCVGSPELPMSDDLYSAHMYCWKAAVVDYLYKSRLSSQQVYLTVSGQHTPLSYDE